MKSDFSKFRLYKGLSIAFMVVAMAAFECCNFFIGGAHGAAIGVTLFRNARKKVTEQDVVKFFHDAGFSHLYRT